jgi:FSR family fosmidomycin resistance protein-like MFS transporter
MVSTPIFMFIFLAVVGWAQFLLLIALGFTALSITPVFLALLAERFPQNRALATGTYMAVGFLVRSAVVVLLGFLADRFGMQTAFVIGGVVSLVGLPLILLLPKEDTPTAGATTS